MKVIRAGILGFCMGVRRAVEIALRETSRSGGQIYTLGPLIHNPMVLRSLEEQGVRILDEGECSGDEENSTFIIRAHGVPPKSEEKLTRQGLRVLDATCPHVKASQRKACFFAKKGYRIFLAGEENHGEIAGIRGYAEAGLSGSSSTGLLPCYVVGTPKDAEKAGEVLFCLEPRAKTVLIGQTTISVSEYRAIGERLRCFFPDLEVLDTICNATADRQHALRDLCGQVDAVIVAGGRESANTRRLHSLALELGKPAWLAETPADLPPEIGAYKTVGLSAGASTPDSLIDEIEEALLSRGRAEAHCL